jgi:PAS domain S-box-containing protein
MSDQETSTGAHRLLKASFLASKVAQVLVDADTKIVVASAGAAELFGLSADRLSGEPMSRFIDACPDLAQFQTKEKVPQGLPMEFDLRRSDGQTVPVQVYCNLTRDETGQLACLLVIHDISHSKFLDEERAARLAKLSLLNQVNEALYGAHLTLDQILEAVLICVTAGQGLGFNRAFLLLIDEYQKTLHGEIAIGPSNREEAERIWRDLADKKQDLYEIMTSYGVSFKDTDVVVNDIVKQMQVMLEDSEHILIQSMRERQAYRVISGMDAPGCADIRHWLKTAEFAVAPLATRRGPVGIIVADNAITSDEITDLDLEFLQLFASVSANAIENSRLYHELEQRLIELRKVSLRLKKDQETMLQMERLSVMGETSAIVAHELRNPLVAIGGFARTLLRSLPSDDPNRQYAKIITEEVARLEKIIFDLLDFIRPQKVTRKLVESDRLVRETVSKFENQLVESNIELVFDLQADNVLIHVNPGEIQQVLQNLLMNCMQVLSEGGRITVRSRLLEGGWQVEVLDDGPGFAADLGDKIFAPFFTTKASGSGLGLTISSQIVKAHGGVLTARNREGGGASFSFILPIPKPNSNSG